LFCIHVVITDYPLHLPVLPYCIPICHHIANMLYCYIKSICNVQIKLLGRYLTRSERNILYLLKCKMLLKCYSCPCINKQFIYDVGYQNMNWTSSCNEPL
jgi:hypothetical protein